VQVGSNYYFYPVGGSSGPQFKYKGAPVTAGQYEWSYIGVEQTGGGYKVAMRIKGTDQYTVWNTDSNGNFVSNGTGGVIVSGSNSAITSLESSFNQDLNGDGVISSSSTPLALASVVQAESNFHFGPEGGGVAQGSPIAAAQNGSWGDIASDTFTFRIDFATHADATSLDASTSWQIAAIAREQVQPAGSGDAGLHSNIIATAPESHLADLLFGHFTIH